MKLEPGEVSPGSNNLRVADQVKQLRAAFYCLRAQVQTIAEEVLILREKIPEVAGVISTMQSQGHVLRQIKHYLEFAIGHADTLRLLTAPSAR